MTNVTVHVTSAPNSFGPGPDLGDGFGWYDGATNGGHQAGSIVEDPPTLIGGAVLHAISAIGGVEFAVIVGGAYAQNTFIAVEFTDQNAVARSYSAASATFSQTAIAGFTTWVWPTADYVYPGGSNSPVVFTDVGVPPAISLDTATVVSGTVVELAWTPTVGTGTFAGTFTGFDVFRDGVQIAAGLGASVLTYNDSTDTPNTLFIYEIHGHYSVAVVDPVISNDVEATTSPLNDEFNCDCVLNAAYATLAELRVRFLIQTGYSAQANNPPPGMAALAQEYMFTAQRQLYLKYKALHTERFYSWTMSPGVRYYDLTASEGDCPAILDPQRTTWVGFEDLNKAWYELIEGIDPIYYTRANINFGWPTRYEIRSCLEIFPAPQAAYTLWVKGHYGLQPFAADGDTPTIDDELILLYAVANYKSAKGQPDAQRAMSQATARLHDLTAGNHGTRRYIPATTQQSPATPPRFLPLGGQQS